MTQQTEELKALVVDVYPVVRETLANMLEKIGYRVTSVSTATEALFHALSKPYDIVISDFELPVTVGYQLGRRIKKQFPATKIVIMTGQCKEEDHDFIENAKMIGWLFKPFTHKELYHTLAQIGVPGLRISNGKEGPVSNMQPSIKVA